MTVHQEQIAPGTAPGAVYVRIVTSSDKLLAEHPLDGNTATTTGYADEALARAWLDDHPSNTVWTHIYDGDDGTCIMTLMIKGADA